MVRRAGARAGHEIWIGDAAQIRASYVRKQKTDKRDAAMLKLVVEGPFSADLDALERSSAICGSWCCIGTSWWRFAPGEKRTATPFLNKGMQRKQQAVESGGTEDAARASAKTVGGVPAGRFAGAAGDVKPADRRAGSGGATGGGRKSAGAGSDDAAGSGSEHGAGLCADHRRCEPLSRGKQVASYLGLIPREQSSGGRQKLGAITKQGNRMLRSLLVEAAQMAVRFDPGLRKQYLHRCHQKPKGVAKVATARKLAVRLYWMLRTQDAVSRDRSHREQPAGAPGRRKLDRRIDWALSHPVTERDVRIEESWSMFRPNRWLVERSSGEDHREVIQREISRVLVLNLSGKTNGAKNTAGRTLSLTPPSLLSRGTRPSASSGYDPIEMERTWSPCGLSRALWFYFNSTVNALVGCYTRTTGRPCEPVAQ